MDDYEIDASKLVLEPIKLDIQRYASMYRGPVKYMRLLHIAQVCPHLRGQAIKLAHDYIKASTFNLPVYEEIFCMLYYWHKRVTQNEDAMDTIVNFDSMKMVKSGNNEAGIVYDDEWIRTTSSRVNKGLDHLESEAKTAQINGILVNTRKAHFEIGDFWLKCGDFSKALNSYIRSREYGQTSGDDLNACLKITRTAIFQSNWSQANAHAKLAAQCFESDLNDNKKPMECTSVESSSEENQNQRNDFRPEKSPERLPVASLSAKTELNLLSGLMDLAAGDYRNAIDKFVQANIDPDDCTYENPSDFVTHIDVARYVTVCALATLDRPALKTEVLNHPSFRLILESEVEARDLLLAFHSADYANVFKRLESLKSYLKLDFFAAKHVEELFRLIRVKALHQYFVPFSKADLRIMAGAFGTSVPDLMIELAELIRKGTINARIDAENQLLCRSNVDDRNRTFKDTIKIIDQCHKRLQAAILRANLVRKGYTSGPRLM